MSAKIRDRGRPIGSGKKEDEGVLMGVARAMVRDPLLKPTTAIKRVMPPRNARKETDETLIRRLQVKWRVQGAELLSRARRELEAKPVTLHDLLVGFGVQNPTLVRLQDQLVQAAAFLDSFENPLKRFLTSPEAVALAERFAEYDKAMKQMAATMPKLPKMPLVSYVSALPPEVRRYQATIDALKPLCISLPQVKRPS